MNGTILITGGTGFLGPYLLEALKKTNRRLRLITRQPQKHQHLQAQGVEVVAGDVTDPDSLERAMPGVTHVVHAAALISLWRKEREAMFATNVQGTQNLLAACAQHPIEKFVYIGALAAVGRPVNGRILTVTEDTPTQPDKTHGVYTETKILAHQAVLQAAQNGLPVIIGIPPLIVGTGTWGESSTALFKLIYDGFQFRVSARFPAVAAVDVAEATWLMLDSSYGQGETFFLVSETLSAVELFGEIARGFGKPAPRLKMPDAALYGIGYLSETVSAVTGKRPLMSLDAVRVMTECPPYTYDGQKITRAFNFQYTPIRQAIAETCQFFLSTLPK